MRARAAARAAVGGGKAKMRWHFGEDGWPTSSLLPHVPESEQDQATLIDTLQVRGPARACAAGVAGARAEGALCERGRTCGHSARTPRMQDWKSQKYRDLIGGGAVAARRGVLRLMDEARASALKVAVCSAATKESVEFTLAALLGEERFRGLDCFLAGDDVPKKKPDPSIYRIAAGAPRALALLPLGAASVQSPPANLAPLWSDTEDAVWPACMRRCADQRGCVAQSASAWRRRSASSSRTRRSALTPPWARACGAW